MIDEVVPWLVGGDVVDPVEGGGQVEGDHAPTQHRQHCKETQSCGFGPHFI